MTIAELQRYPAHAPVHVERLYTDADGMCVDQTTMPAERVTPGGSPYGVVIQGEL